MSDQAPSNIAEYSVSEISRHLKRRIEDEFGHVRIRGEISRFTRAKSGHCYFPLKDEDAVLDAVMWKGQAARLSFQPEEGMEVVVTGKLTTYPGRSAYQIIVDSMEVAGAGALMAMLEERKKRLAAEGLFAADHKKPLPFLPAHIGIVTSPTGAVIRDILHRLADRFPRRVTVWPVQVQGEGAPAQIVRAIEGFNGLTADRPDLLIVARGGGSLEDLMAFNDEAVVRAAFASAIPLISAVGHETDTTLIDYASDRRAPTPTAAAEIAVPVRRDLMASVGELGTRALRAQTRSLRERKNRVEGLGRGLPRLSDLLALPRQRLDAASAGLPRGLTGLVRHHRNRVDRAGVALRPVLLQRHVRSEKGRLAALEARLSRAQGARIVRVRERLDFAQKMMHAYSYQGVLDRGFALVRDAAGNPVKRAADTVAGAAVSIEFADGRRAARMEGEGGPDRAPAPKKTKKAAPKPAKGPQKQQSLFDEDG